MIAYRDRCCSEQTEELCLVPIMPLRYTDVNVSSLDAAPVALGFRRSGAGLIAEIRRRFPGRRFERAISVGCGAAGKELLLLKENLIQEIDLFEISATRIEGNESCRSTRRMMTKPTLPRK